MFDYCLKHEGRPGILMTTSLIGTQVPGHLSACDVKAKGSFIKKLVSPRYACLIILTAQLGMPGNPILIINILTGERDLLHLDIHEEFHLSSWRCFKS